VYNAPENRGRLKIDLHSLLQVEALNEKVVARQSRSGNDFCKLRYRTEPVMQCPLVGKQLLFPNIAVLSENLTRFESVARFRQSRFLRKNSIASKDYFVSEGL
jgi:hypothetical protein